MSSNTTHFTPADAVPCLKCGEQPTAWRIDFGHWCTVCFCQGARGAVNCLSLEDAVAAWNRLNCPEIPDSSSNNGE